MASGKEYGIRDSSGKRSAIKQGRSLILVFLAIQAALFGLFSNHAGAEETGGAVTLRYSSFDGGGYLYAVHVADETVVRGSLRYDYGGQNHEIEDGSPFDVLITLTAVQPGGTEAVISWESPILPPGEAHYTVIVADDLTVTLKEEPYMRVSIYDAPFMAALEDNATAAAFAGLLPMKLDMEELNGNEVYHYLKGPLPSAPERVGHVNAGDIMLFGDSCVVIFYESFDTPYSYTRIGRIAEADELAEAIAGRNVFVTFEKMGN